MELIQGVDVSSVRCRDFFHKNLSTATKSMHRHVVNRARNDILHKNKQKIFSVYPAPYPQKSPTGPL